VNAPDDPEGPGMRSPGDPALKKTTAGLS